MNTRVLDVLPDDAPDLARLREMVRRHQVCWDSRPERAVVGETLLPVGFIVEITATHDHPARQPLSGCPACAAPLRALEAIVAFVLPQGRRDSVYDVQVRWGSLQYAHRRGNRPEVTAMIHVLHAEGANRPVDPCEERCLHEITDRLKELGAAEGTWPALPSVE